MATARFVYANLALSATITASAEVTNRPASYLSSPARWKKWRSTTTTGDQNVVFDFGGSQTVQCVALVGWRRHTGGAIRADYWDGSAWQTFGTFTLPSANPTGLVVLWNTTGVSTTKVRIYFTNTAAASDYVELGVAVIGTYYAPTYGIADGCELVRVDPSDVVAAIGGQEQAQTRTKYFEVSGQFGAMPEADKDAVLAMYEANGRTVPLLWAVDPDDVDQILYCRLSAVQAFPHAFGTHWDLPIAATEVR